MPSQVGGSRGEAAAQIFDITGVISRAHDEGPPITSANGPATLGLAELGGNSGSDFPQVVIEILRLKEMGEKIFKTGEIAAAGFRC